MKWHPFALSCRGTWATFNPTDANERWAAPLIGFGGQSAGNSARSAYEYLLSSNLTDTEASAKLRMIRAAQRRADERAAQPPKEPG